MNSKNIPFKSGIALVVSLLCLLQTVFSQETNLQAGGWLGLLQLNDSTQLPFNFEINNNQKLSLEITNAEERIEVNEIHFVDDSVFIKMPVFDSEFRCRLNKDTIKGNWISHARKDKNVIPFIAFPRRPLRCGTETSIYPSPLAGKWECTFNPQAANSSKAIGVFKPFGKGANVSGTFLTETGDYRYLKQERSSDGKFHLSCFDGAHAFLFTGEVKGDSIINGHFYSGAHSHETWGAIRNDKFELRNPDSLTYLKSGYTKIDFNFKNLEGKSVSLNDDKFKNKVVIVQIMGSWCPNCMDETKFLAPFYDKYRSKGLEIVALAFERTDDFNRAVSNVNRMKNKFNANYEFLITMKQGSILGVSEALPMLNKVMAFPTTIYIDKNGIVRKIYTGFYGPATGDNYTKYVEETTRFVEKLLAE